MKNNYILGTAGHIDHGKTQLIKALTGKETDRLDEEKRRGISIKLGFANLELENGNLGIIDVPGHEKFIKEMLSGSFGLDIVLLVISAEDGIMPQTKEHLEILNHLNITNIIYVITKTSLVEKVQLEKVIRELQDYLKILELPDKKIITVDSIDGTNIENLKDLINTSLYNKSIINEYQNLKIPIDRKFTIKGIGTVITGTIWNGEVNLNQQIYLMPNNKKVKVRSIENHNKSVDIGKKGQRIALNITDTELNDIKPGAFLTDKEQSSGTFKALGYLKTTTFAKDIINGSILYIYHGTKETEGKLILLEEEKCRKAGIYKCVIYFKEEIYCNEKDIIILRSENKDYTIGSLKVLNTNPHKSKRFNQEYISQYFENNNSNLLNSLNKIIGNRGFYFDTNSEYDLCTLESDNYLKTESGLIFEKDIERLITTHIQKELEIKQRTNRFIESINKEELRQKFFSGLNLKYINELFEMIELKNIKLIQGNIILTDFTRTKEVNEIYSLIMDIIEKNGIETPILKDAHQINSLISKEEYIEALNNLSRTGSLVKVNRDIYITDKLDSYLKNKIREKIISNNGIKLNEARDILKTSRKYALGYLEYLDENKVTKRIDDIRVLR